MFYVQFATDHANFTSLMPTSTDLCALQLIMPMSHFLLHTTCALCRLLQFMSQPIFVPLKALQPFPSLKLREGNDRDICFELVHSLLDMNCNKTDNLTIFFTRLMILWVICVAVLYATPLLYLRFIKI